MVAPSVMVALPATVRSLVATTFSLATNVPLSIVLLATVSDLLKITLSCAIIPFIETSLLNISPGKTPPTILLAGILLSLKEASNIPVTVALPATVRPFAAIMFSLAIIIPLVVNVPLSIVSFTTLSFSLKLTSPCAIIPFIETSVLNVLAGKTPSIILLAGILFSLNDASNIPVTVALPVTVRFALARIFALAINTPLVVNVSFIIEAPFMVSALCIVALSFTIILPLTEISSTFITV